MTDDLAPAVKLATEFRENGVRAQIYTEKKKFKAKIGYADKLNIPYAVFLGEDEIANESATVKNMKTGEQSTLPTADAVNAVKAALESFEKTTVICE